MADREREARRLAEADRASLTISEPAAVARSLLGATVVSELGGERVAIRLTEVEAYAGTDDPASHAYRGRTPRNQVMFGRAGLLYVYFTFGMHWCANVVCGPEDEASAVLLRAGEVVEGRAVARERRTSARTDRELARGPAKLAAALGLTGSEVGIDLLDRRQPVQLAGLLASVAPEDIATGPRVGLSKAPDTPWRFWVRGDPTVSLYRAGGRHRGGSPA